MNLKLSFWAVLCAALVVGCSSVPTRVNKGPLHATTYSFMTSKAPPSVVVNQNRQEIHKLIQGDIARELKQKGLQQVASGGDVLVGYMVIVADNATTASYDDYFGYGREGDALSDKVQKMVNRSKNRQRFDVGAIVIDVVDPRNSKLLFRSYARTDLQDVTPANRAERINTLIASCLGALQASP